MAEVPKHDIENHDKNIDKEIKDNPIDSKLDTEFRKTDTSMTDGVERMADQELDAVIKKFGPELSNQNKLSGIKQNFMAEAVVILSGPWTTAEKIKNMEHSFHKFEVDIGAVMGTQEAKDAKISRDNSRGMEEGDAKNETQTQKFKEALLKNIKDSIEEKAKEQRKKAEYLWTAEQKYSQMDADKTISATLAFWPPGNSGREKTTQA